MSNKQNVIFFFFLSFLFCKIRKQEGKTGPAQRGGLALVGGWRWQKKGIGGLIQCRKCVHTHVIAIVIPVVTIP
jgi:hypothetical protein